jgi:hypothetical protein
VKRLDLVDRRLRPRDSGNGFGSHTRWPVPFGGTFAGKEAPQVDVDLNPVLVRECIDVNVYKVSMSINPAAGTQYSLHFANSATQKV